VIGSVVAVTLPGFVLGAVIMALGNRRLASELARARWVKLIVFFVIVHVVLGVAAAGRPWVTCLVALILAAGAVELRSAWVRVTAPRPVQVWIVYALAAAVSTAASWWLPPPAFAFIFLVTATCDGFSQVVGQLAGRRRLAPQLSPAKTIGGLVGGLVAAVGVAVFARELIDAAPLAAAGIAVTTGLAGLAGDLAASWVKRRAGLKDYSNALPGQGGFLDRFDSLLGAMTLVGIALAISGG